MSVKTQLSGKRRVFNLLRSVKGISRAALAQHCGLTRPAVSAIVMAGVILGGCVGTGIYFAVRARKRKRRLVTLWE